LLLLLQYHHGQVAAPFKVETQHGNIIQQIDIAELTPLQSSAEIHDMQSEQITRPAEVGPAFANTHMTGCSQKAGCLDIRSLQGTCMNK